VVVGSELVVTTALFTALGLTLFISLKTFSIGFQCAPPPCPGCANKGFHSHKSPAVCSSLAILRQASSSQSNAIRPPAPPKLLCQRSHTASHLLLRCSLIPVCFLASGFNHEPLPALRRLCNTVMTLKPSASVLVIARRLQIVCMKVWSSTHS
jgi:hypothetical protein